MKFSLNDDSRGNIVSAYSEGSFTVSGQILTGSHLIWPEKSPSPWPVEDITKIIQTDIEALTSAQVEAIIIGTGNQLVFPDDKWMEYFLSQAIGVEIMDTPAACRTYNILVAEDRNVLAALIPV